MAALASQVFLVACKGLFAILQFYKWLLQLKTFFEMPWYQSHQVQILIDLFVDSSALIKVGNAPRCLP